MLGRQEKHETINRVVKPFDWSYTTDYKGTVTTKGVQFEPSESPIPLELLKRPDPILFFDELVLYEDEMADNGITMLSCKIRVMPDRLLLLTRFFMRLDNVLFRLRDTRVYVEFATGDVIREHTAREEDYEKVREVWHSNSWLVVRRANGHGLFTDAKFWARRCAGADARPEQAGGGSTNR
jgi:type 2A phosphatase activator TIP41